MSSNLAFSSGTSLLGFGNRNGGEWVYTQAGSGVYYGPGKGPGPNPDAWKWMTHDDAVTFYNQRARMGQPPRAMK